MTTDRCPTCDEWYDPNGERAKVHKHPEPQSGPPRDAWLASKLPYEEWVVKTDEGRAWAGKETTLATSLYELGALIEDLEYSLRCLEGENRDLRGLCERAVESWGDYVPRPQTNAAKVLREMKDHLERFEEVVS